MAYRYFSKKELKAVFTMSDPKNSATCKQLQELHTGKVTNKEVRFQKHLEFLNGLDGISGISHHDLLFSTDADDE